MTLNEKENQPTDTEPENTLIGLVEHLKTTITVVCMFKILEEMLKYVK